MQSQEFGHVLYYGVEGQSSRPESGRTTVGQAGSGEEVSCLLPVNLRAGVYSTSIWVLLADVNDMETHHHR